MSDTDISDMLEVMAELDAEQQAQADAIELEELRAAEFDAAVQYEPRAAFT